MPLPRLKILEQGFESLTFASSVGRRNTSAPLKGLVLERRLFRHLAWAEVWRQHERIKHVEVRKWTLMREKRKNKRRVWISSSLKMSASLLHFFIQKFEHGMASNRGQQRLGLGRDHHPWKTESEWSKGFDRFKKDPLPWDRNLNRGSCLKICSDQTFQKCFWQPLKQI